MLDAIHRYFHSAADVIGLDSRVREIILALQRVGRAALSRRTIREQISLE